MARTILARAFRGPSPNLKTLPSASSFPSVSDLSAPYRLGSWLHFSSSPRSLDLAQFRRLLARAEMEKQRWEYAKRMTGEDDKEDEVGIDAVVERFERLVEGWGGGRGQQEVDKECVFQGRDDPADAHEEVQTFNFDRVFQRHRMLLEGCAKAETSNDVHMWMVKITQFEEKYFSVILKCRNGQKMLDELNAAGEKERPILIKKIVHMVGLEFGKSPSPDSLLNHRHVFRNIKFLNEKKPWNSLSKKGKGENDQAGSMGNDVELLQKLHDIDKMVEERLTGCNHLQTQHERKDKNLENENLHIDMTPHGPKIHYFKHKGFDLKLINVSRKYGKAKTGKVVKYIVLMACGNYNGTIGFALAEAPTFQTALEKGCEQCFENLHYVCRHDNGTIPHPLLAKHKNTKIYLWPAPAGKGIKASRTVETVARLAGFTDIRSKVAGYRTPLESLIALFKALGATRITRGSSG